MPTYQLSRTSLIEGNTTVYTITTTDVADGTTLYWTKKGTASIYDVQPFEGSFVINNNTGSFSVKIIGDELNENSAETFGVQVRTDSLTGTIVIDEPITFSFINDNEFVKYYAYIANGNLHQKGSTIDVRLVTNGVQNGVVLYYVISSAFLDPNTITTPLTGTVVVNNNSAQLLISTNSAATLSVDPLDNQAIVSFRILDNGGPTLANTPVVFKLQDTVPLPIRSWSKSTSTVSPGNSFTITFSSTNTSENVPYTITGVTSADLGGAPLTGSVSHGTQKVYVVASNAINFVNKQFIIQENSTLVSTSVNIATSGIYYSLSPSTSSVNEGNSFTIAFTTSESGSFPYTITGVSSADIGGAPLTGTVTHNDVLNFTVTADAATEGTEIFTIALDNGQVSTSITINDTSVPTYSLSSNTSVVDEGSSFNITFTTDQAGSFPYTITGVSSADIGGAALTGTVTNNQVLTFNVTADSSTEGTETFNIALDNGLASTSVNIYDTSTTPVSGSAVFRSRTNDTNQESTYLRLLIQTNGAVGSTDIKDWSDHRWYITNVGGVELTSIGGKTGAYFNGTSSHLQVPVGGWLTVASSSTFTYEAWVYLTPGGSNFRPILSSVDNYATWALVRDSNQNWIIELLYSNIFSGGYKIASTPALSSSVLTTGTWHHIALVRSSVSGSPLVYFYVDGQSVGTSGGSDVPNAAAIYVGGAYVGRSDHMTANASSAFFDGYIKDLRITNGIPKYASNFTPPEGPFINWFSKLYEGETNTYTVDTSGFSNGTTLYWTSAIGFDLVASSGNFTVNNGSGSFDVTAVVDSEADSGETFTVEVRTGGVSGTVIATSPSTEILDIPSGNEVYEFIRSAASVNEGGSFTVTFTTSQSGSFPYTITGVSSADIGGASLTGTVTNNQVLTFTVTADATTEGTENFVITLDNSLATATVTINDTSTASYSLTRSVSSVNEGTSFTVTFTTNQAGSFPYTITGVSSADIGGASLTGTVTNNQVLTFNVTADLTTEGTETFNIALNNGQASTSVTINDTSTASYTLTRSASSVNEGDSFTVTFTTNQSGSFPYTITGVSSADIGGASLTGTVTNNQVLTFNVTADVTTEGTETFNIALNNGEASTSVTINDTSVPVYNIQKQLPNSAVFQYVGYEETWYVPAGVTSINVKMWGAGGGSNGGLSGSAETAKGGAGGFLKFTKTVIPGEALKIKVGGGGKKGYTAGRYPGSGGGRTEIIQGSTIWAVAGAGGGGGGYGNSNNNSWGGSGGGLTAAPGGAASVYAVAGGGGTQSSGGSGGTPGPGQAGSYQVGGDGSDVGATFVPGGWIGGGKASIYAERGGGGGAGFYGGGGGGGNGTWGAGGGGGSSYTLGATNVTHLTSAANTTTPPGTDEVGYIAGVAEGGINYNDGGNGLVIIEYGSGDGSGLDEGSSSTFTVSTNGVADGTTLYWTVSNTTTGNLDFATTNGSFTVTNSLGTFSVSATADGITEGPETFVVNVRTGSTSGPIVATTGTITINDTSLTQVYSIRAPDPYFDQVALLLSMDGTNGGTTFTDLSSNGVLITKNNNAQITTTDPKFGSGSLTVNGGYLNTTSSNLFDFSATSFTVECWINTTNFSQNSAGIFGQRISGIYCPFEVRVTGGALFWLISNSSINSWSANATTGGVLSSNTWHHIALVGDGTNLTLYVDGISRLSTSQPAWTSANRTMYIGQGGDGGFSGKIDDFRITKGVARYTANFTPPTTAFSSTKQQITEGQTNTFTVDAPNTPDGTTLYWEVLLNSNATSADFVATTGNFQINGGVGTFDIEVVTDSNIEGTENYTVLVKNSPGGNNLAISTALQIAESVNISVAADSATVVEGESSTFTVTTSGIQDNTEFNWSVGTLSNTTPIVDIVNSTGTVTIVGNTGVITVTTTETSGGKSFNVDILGANNQVIASSELVSIAQKTYEIVVGSPEDPYFEQVSLLLSMDSANGGTTFTDSSVSALTVTPSGNVQISTAQSKFGGSSAYFPGGGFGTNFLSLGTWSPLNSSADPELVLLKSEGWTFECWIRPDENYEPTLWTGGSPGQLFIVDPTRARPIFGTRQFNQAGDTLIITTNTTIPANTWAHIALVVEINSSPKLYIDGVLKATGNSIGDSSIRTIGYNGNTNGSDFKGYIDDVRITKGVARYTANFTPPTAGFTGSSTTVSEGDIVTYTVNTTNVADGTVFFWSLDSASTVEPEDINAPGSLDTFGTFVVNNNTGQFQVEIAEDFQSDGGSETLVVSISRNSQSGTKLATSPAVTILDTSLASATYQIAPNTTTVSEGGQVTFTVTTTNLSAGVTLYWKYFSPNSAVTDSDFVNPSGSIQVANGGVTTFTVTLSEDLSTEGLEQFVVELKTGSITGTVVATSDAVTIQDTSLTPIVLITATSNSVNENDAITFNVNTTNVPNNTTLYWTINTSEETAAVEDFISTSGNFTVNNSNGSFAVQIYSDALTEVGETFRVDVRSVSISGPVLSTSNQITINNTTQVLPTYTVTPSSLSVNEGSTLTVNVTTTNVINYTTLYWTIEPVTTTSADFVQSSGSFEVVSQTGSFNLIVAADRLTEGSETFTIKLRTGSVSGTVVSTSNVITIQDTSLTPSYVITPSTLTVSENSLLSITVTTTDVVNGTVLYWTVQNTTTNSSDFVSTSGNFTVTNNTGTFQVGIVGDVTTESDETFQVQIRTGSVSGTVVATSEVITVSDTSKASTYIVTDDPNYSSSTDQYYEFVQLLLDMEGTNGSNIFTDRSTNNIVKIDRTGSTNPTLTNTISKYGLSSGSFNNNGYIYNLALGNKATYEAWVRLTQYPVSQYTGIFGRESSAALLGVTPAGNLWTQYTGGHQLSSIIPLNEWVHVAFSRDGDSFRLFLNGELKISGTNSTWWAKEASQLYLGSTYGNTGGIVGYIDEVRCTNGIVRYWDNFTPPINAHYFPEPGVVIPTPEEGSAFTFYIFTTDVQDGTQLYWTLGTGTAVADDFVTTSGTVTITNNQGTFTVTPKEDSLTEGAETFTVQLRTGSNTGPVVATSAPKSILDTSVAAVTNTVVPRQFSVSEGGSVTFDVVTSTISSGTLYWTIDNVTTQDVDFSLVSGSFTVSGGTGNFTVTAVSDSLTEGTQSFTVSVRTGSTTGTVISTSDTVTILDTSIAASGYTITPVTNTLTEGGILQLNVTTTNLATGTNLWWKIDHGTTDDSDFVTNSGVIPVNNNIAVFSITSVEDDTTEGNQTFTVKLYSDSGFNNVVATTSSITLLDTSLSPVTYSITPDVNSIEEGEVVTYTVTTTGVTNGTKLYWNRKSTSTASSLDVAPTSGEITISGGTATFQIQALNDLNSESSETLVVEIRTGGLGGPVVATATDVLIVNVVPTFVIITTAGQGSSGADPLFSLVTLLLPMDGNNGSTTFTDLSSYSRNITSYGTVQISNSQVMFGTGSAYFDGTDTAIKISDTTLQIGPDEDFTIEAWIYITSAGDPGSFDYNTVISLIPDTDNGTLYVREFEGGARISWYDDTNNAYSGYMDLNTWYHVAVTRSSGTVRTFVDGVASFDVQTNSTLALGDTTGNGIAGVIGNSIYDERFKGYIDDVRITKGVARYTADFNPPTSAFSSSTGTGTGPVETQEGVGVTFYVSTTSVPDGTLVYWTLGAGTAVADDFLESSGVVEISNNQGSFTVTPKADNLTEGSETFSIQLRTGSVSGPLVGASPTITLQDTSINVIPTYSISGPTSIIEGFPVTYTVTTTGVPDGRTLYWKFVTGDSSDFNLSSGSIVINNNTAPIIITPLEDNRTEGPKSFSIGLYPTQGSLTPLTTSNTVTVQDTSITINYQFSVAQNLQEGVLGTITVSALGLQDGTQLTWEIQPVTTNLEDFETTTGTVTITGGTGEIQITPVADNLTEGPQSFQIKLFKSGVLVSTSQEFQVEDTSLAPPAPGFNPQITTVFESGSVVFDVNLVYPNGTTLYWTINPSSTTGGADFVENSGSFVINNNLGTFTVQIATDDILIEGTEVFLVDLHTDSIDGPVIATSNQVEVIPGILNALVTPGYGSFTINIKQPTESDGVTPRDDLIGVKLWVFNEPDFIPDDSNLIFDGNSLSITISDLPGGERVYIKYALISDIDPDDFIISPQYSIIPFNDDSLRDTTPAPTPTGVEITPLFNSIIITHDSPSYTVRRRNAQTIPGHRATLVFGAEVEDETVELTYIDPRVKLLGQFFSNSYSFPVNPNSRWRLWLVWLTIDGVASEVPAGGEFGFYAAAGQDVTPLLNSLTRAAFDPNSPYSKVTFRSDLFAIGPEVTFSQESQPTATEQGQLWYNTATGVTQVWDGNAWSEFSNTAPFIVNTLPQVINGNKVEPGVYMDGATIKNGTIVDAKIGNLAAGKITAGYTTSVDLESSVFFGSEFYIGGVVTYEYNNPDFPTRKTGIASVANPLIMLKGGPNPVAEFTVDTLKVKTTSNSLSVPLLTVDGTFVRVNFPELGNNFDDLVTMGYRGDFNATRNKIYTQEGEPYEADLYNGDIWHNPSNDLMKSWDDTNKIWVLLSTVGAPVGTLIGNTLAEVVDLATTNFNSRNDRIGDAILDPVISNIAGTIDHVINTDGSCDISFEWSWSGVDAEIDGFVVYVHDNGTTQPSTQRVLTDVTNPSQTLYYVTPNYRAFILPGVASDHWYTFGVKAYRIVDPDVKTSGIISSNIVQPLNNAPETTQGAYLPEANVAFAGDVTGTVDGTAATIVKTATVNFNSRNDRLATTIDAPIVSNNAGTLDHVINTDGSCDISFEWAWGGSEADIDGFVVYVHDNGVTQRTSRHVFTDAPNPKVVTFFVIPQYRAFVLTGVAADHWYTFGVKAYRIVDPDVDASGIISSNISQPASNATETTLGAYRPSANIAFAGDVTGTIGQVAASTVRDNAQLGADAYDLVTDPNTGLETRFSNATLNILQPGVRSGFATGTVAVATNGTVSGTGVLLTGGGIAAYKNGQPTFALDGSNGNAVFKGEIAGANGYFTGSVRGGNFESYNWPTSSGSGFYVGPEGALWGNYNTGKGAQGFVQISSDGRMWIGNPGATIFRVDSTGLKIGNGRFHAKPDGTLDVDQINIGRREIVETGFVYPSQDTLIYGYDAETGYGGVQVTTPHSPGRVTTLDGALSQHFILTNTYDYDLFNTAQNQPWHAVAWFDGTGTVWGARNGFFTYFQLFAEAAPFRTYSVNGTVGTNDYRVAIRLTGRAILGGGTYDRQTLPNRIRWALYKL